MSRRATIHDAVPGRDGIAHRASIDRRAYPRNGPTPESTACWNDADPVETASPVDEESEHEGSGRRRCAGRNGTKRTGLSPRDRARLRAASVRHGRMSLNSPGRVRFTRRSDDASRAMRAGFEMAGQIVVRQRRQQRGGRVHGDHERSKHAQPYHARDRANVEHLNRLYLPATNQCHLPFAIYHLPFAICHSRPASRTRCTAPTTAPDAKPMTCAQNATPPSAA